MYIPEFIMYTYIVQFTYAHTCAVTYVTIPCTITIIYKVQCTVYTLMMCTIELRVKCNNDERQARGKPTACATAAAAAAVLSYVITPLHNDSSYYVIVVVCASDTRVCVHVCCNAHTHGYHSSYYSSYSRAL